MQLRESESLRVDLWELDRLLDAAASARDSGDCCQAAGHLEAAVELWRGQPLDDLRALPEMEPVIERTTLRYLEALHALGELRLIEGDPGAAAIHARQAIAVAAHDERGHRLREVAAQQLGSPDR